MDRILKMPVGLSVERVSYQLVITIDLQSTPIPEWCLNLCLLKQQLASALVFLLGKKKLKIEMNSVEGSRRAKVFLAPNQVHVVVQPAELNRWMNFFLKYYRDGVAEVDHIDVEALVVSDEPEDVYIIFIVKDAVPPMPAEEARKILDKYDQ
ncbi:MAG: hypothetical protein ACRD9R_15955 [Pyrinomonadaceae bacterium]